MGGFERLRDEICLTHICTALIVWDFSGLNHFSATYAQPNKGDSAWRRVYEIACVYFQQLCTLAHSSHCEKAVKTSVYAFVQCITYDDEVRLR